MSRGRSQHSRADLEKIPRGHAPILSTPDRDCPEKGGPQRAVLAGGGGGTGERGFGSGREHILQLRGIQTRGTWLPWGGKSPPFLEGNLLELHHPVWGLLATCSYWALQICLEQQGCKLLAVILGLTEGSQVALQGGVSALCLVQSWLAIRGHDARLAQL